MAVGEREPGKGKDGGVWSQIVTADGSMPAWAVEKIAHGGQLTEAEIRYLKTLSPSREKDTSLKFDERLF